MKMRRNTKGVTMIELMIVTVMVGIIATLAIPRFVPVIHKLKLKNAGRDMISSLRLARSNAVSQRCQFGVYFNLNENEYVLFKDLANLGSFTYDAGSDSDAVTRTLPTKVNFGYTNFPNWAIVFKPDGSASSSGLVELYCYEDYSGSYTVDVLGSTGRVKLISGYVGQYGGGG
jgi:prepilin-type N-terminal cleavage/methylation domain-containing protein